MNVAHGRSSRLKTRISVPDDGICSNGFDLEMLGLAKTNKTIYV